VPRPAPWADTAGRIRVFRGDSRRLDMIGTGSVGVILTSPPYWVRGRGRDSAERYARQLAVRFGREWQRVLRDDGDLWLVIGDRHDGREWVGIDESVVRWLRRTGWRLQAKGLWAQTRSRERWDNRVNHVLRFGKVGRVVHPNSRTLCWTLPLPRSHPESRWDATPEPVIRAALAESRKRGAVLDPFAGSGTVGLVARAMGRAWIGVERDPRMAALAARRLRLRPPARRRARRLRVRAGARSARASGRRA
jgi:site-specific DNA-methyltransferase (cytosine-N4-specific)